MQVLILHWPAAVSMEGKIKKRRDGTREERTQIRAMRDSACGGPEGAGIRSGGRGALRAAQRRAIRQASSTATLGTPESGPDISLRRIKMASSKYRRSGLDTTITRREMPFTITVSAPLPPFRAFAVSMPRLRRFYTAWTGCCGAGLRRSTNRLASSLRPPWRGFRPSTQR